METGKYAVNIEKRTVTMGHKTKTSDGSVELTTTFDFANVSLARLLYFAASACLIKWRASSGIKKLTTAEAMKKLADQTVDCSKSTERVKHVETAEEKELKQAINDILAGKTGKKMDLAEIAAKLRELSQKSEDNEMSEGEE